MASRVWYTRGTWVTQDDSRRVLWNGSVLVEDGLISRIVARPLRSSETRGTRVVDLGGQIVVPGFVQTHVHLCQTLFRNHADDLELLDWLSQRVWPFEAAHSAETMYHSALLGAGELLAGGTTTILDMGSVRHTARVLEAIEASGIRAVAGKCLMDRADTCPVDLCEGAEASIRETEKLFRDWHGRDGGRIALSYAPRFAVSCSDSLLRWVGDLARDKGVLIHTHSSENKAEVDLVRRMTGRDNVEYFHSLGLTGERLVLAHCVWLSERERQILLETGTRVAHCPSSNLKLASGIAPIPDLLKAGVVVGLGADGAPCNNQLSQWEEMRLAALVQKPEHGPQAMPAQQVFDLANRGGAAVLGMASQIGTIEEGKRADFCVVERDAWARFTGGLGRTGVSLPGSPEHSALVSSLVYSTQASHVLQTFVGGREVYRRGKGLTQISSRGWEKELEKSWRKVSRGVR